MAGLGEILQHTRQMRGVSLEEAERATHISRRYLQALEEEDFSVFVAPVFARGFLRNYSQYLGLDPNEMLEYWPGDTTPPPEPPPADDTEFTLSDVRGPRADTETARVEFERRAEPLRPRRTTPRRARTAPTGDAPSPLTRPTITNSGSAPATPPARVLTIAAALAAVMAVLAIVAGRGGGSSTARSSNAGATVTPGRGTANQPRPTQQPPARKAGSMPELVGKDGAASVQQLQQVGITPLLIYVQSSNRSDRPGAVTKQDPSAGTALNTNSAVTLIVNPGGATPGPAVSTRPPTPRAGASSAPAIPTVAPSPRSTPTVTR